MMAQEDKVEEQVTFVSGSLRLAGVLHLPDAAAAGNPVPCVMVLHGFATNKDAANVTGPVRMLNEWGCAAFRFDMRGCGDSEGTYGRVIALEQVDDTRAAMDYLQSRPEIASDQIGVLGSSFGAAVALYAGGIDDRFACVIASGGWGNGERKLRGQHPGPEGWSRFEAMLERGRRYAQEHGESMMVDRYEIVPVPEHMRDNVISSAAQTLPVDVAEAMLTFRPDDVVGGIAPRPLLLLHAANDSVTPTSESIALFERAGSPCDLHLFAETDHFMLAENNARVRDLVQAWLARYFPAARR